MQRFRQHWKRNLGIIVGVLVVLFVVLQLVPVDRTNPPVVSEPNWDSPQTRTLVKAACFDCHSNETVWPWYSHVAPVKFLIASDVHGGRRAIDFSDWNNRRQRVGEIAEVVNSGEMPPWFYLIMHPNARLSSADKQALIDGLTKTIAQSPGAILGGAE
jgi:cytochrome c551/c552